MEKKKNERARETGKFHPQGERLMEGFVKFPKIKFVLLKINPPSAVKGKEGEMRLP